MKRESIKSNYFYGNAISEYGLKNGYVDYRTLAKCGDMVMCNDITKLFYDQIGRDFVDPQQVNGYIDNSEQINELEREQDEQPDIYQYYIVSGPGAELLQEYTNDPVFYVPVLDCYVWGVTHWGTSWDYVLTDVKLELD